MSDEKKCLKCSSQNIVPCELQSTGKLYARPKHAKLTTIFTTGVLMHADVCFFEIVTSCNNVDLTLP